MSLTFEIYILLFVTYLYIYINPIKELYTNKNGEKFK